ncbi:MAG: hypothetical protein K9J16_10645 [Melioribacteraceae bacterium]|nr:hypothetical protein [Melioribacteraceae bacterium]MCF8355176.1 hypothetical protein [Melioribacteraceae bacterium]MCF8395389.1 hypothetical protein [Melioribacteraceae bacterium]MCF8419905.1 hypothetical protein [Melioribacteraceae bacterium]
MSANEYDHNLKSSANFQRLKRVLTFNVSNIFIWFAIVIFLIGGTIATILGIAISIAIFGASVMVFKILLEEKKRGWILGMILGVIIPYLIALIFAAINKNLMWLPLIPTGFLFFYCFLLLPRVIDWIKDIGERNRYILDKRKRDEELEAFMNQIKTKID